MRNILNEQTNITDAFNAGCFNQEKYPWFTIDGGKQPKKTNEGKLVVTGKNSKGEPVWFYDIVQGETTGVYQNRQTGGTKRWSCDVAGIKSAQASGELKAKQEQFINDFIADNQNYSKEDKSEYEKGVKFTPVDVSTLPGGNTIFKPKERYIYKRTGSANVKIEQQPEIEQALNNAGFTLKEPAVTSFLYGKKMDITKIMDGKYAQYYKTLGGDGTSVIYVWPMDKAEIDRRTIKQDIKSLKQGQLSKKDCKTAIKALAYYANTNADIDDDKILQIKNQVWSCYSQNKDLLNSSVGNELKNLISMRGKFGLRDFAQSIQKESEVRLGKLIKEHLTLASIQKKKTILTEGEIIKTRLNILTEDRKPKSKKELGKLFDNLIAETAYLHNQGFNQDIINEGFMDIIKGLFGNASTSIFQYFKEHLAEWLLTKFTSVDPNSWLGSVIVTAIGNVPITEIPNLTNCSYTSKLLSKSIVEAMGKKIQNERGLSAPGYDILRNATFEMIEDSAFGQKIEQKISDFICPQLQKLTSKLGMVGDKMKTGALKSTGGLIPKISQ